MMVNLGEKISVLVEKQLKEITKNKIHSSRNAKNYSLNQKNMDKIRHDIYPLGACVILGNSILSGILEENLSNELPVKVRGFPGATVEGLQHHALAIIWKKPKFIILHAGANDAVRTTRKILNKLLQPKVCVNEKLPEAEITTTPTLCKAALTVRQLTKHLTTLKIYILDNWNVSGKHLSRWGLHLYHFKSFKWKTLFLNCGNFWVLEHLNKLYPSPQVSKSLPLLTEKRKPFLRVQTRIQNKISIVKMLRALKK